MRTSPETSPDDPWTPGLIREAAARIYELAAILHRDRKYDEALALATSKVDTEQNFRSALRLAGFDRDRIYREVRRVWALHFGYLIRQYGYRVDGKWMTGPEMDEIRSTGRCKGQSVLRAVRVVKNGRSGA